MANEGWNGAGVAGKERGDGLQTSALLFTIAAVNIIGSKRLIDSEMVELKQMTRPKAD